MRRREGSPGARSPRKIAPQRVANETEEGQSCRGPAEVVGGCGVGLALPAGAAFEREPGEGDDEEADDSPGTARVADDVPGAGDDVFDLVDTAGDDDGFGIRRVVRVTLGREDDLRALGLDRDDAVRRGLGRGPVAEADDVADRDRPGVDLARHRDRADRHGRRHASACDDERLETEDRGNERCCQEKGDGDRDEPGNETGSSNRDPRHLHFPLHQVANLLWVSLGGRDPPRATSYGLFVVCSASNVNVAVVDRPCSVLLAPDGRETWKQSTSLALAFSVRSPAWAPCALLPIAPAVS